MKPTLIPPIETVIRLGASLLDVLYPPRCVGCYRGLRVDEQPLCAVCLDSLERVDSRELEAHVRSNIPDWKAGSVYAHWMFDKGGTLQRAQHLLKYGQRPRFGLRLGHELARGWEFAIGARLTLVVPLPLHRTRQLERGYNQSHSLALGFCGATDLPIDSRVLRRSGATRRQTGLSREARRENVAGRFRAESALLAGAHVLLVDDVITTGATASACVDALLQQDVASVHVAALAHARV